MRASWRRSVTPSARANDVATHTVVHSEGGRAAASAIARMSSANGPWETSPKQVGLWTYVTGVITHERNTSDADYLQPAGAFEMLAGRRSRSPMAGRPTLPSWRSSSTLKIQTHTLVIGEQAALSRANVEGFKCLDAACSGLFWY